MIIEGRILWYIYRGWKIILNEIKIRMATIENVVAISVIKIEGWQTTYKNIINEDY